ncbi:hypothetical protein N9Y42_01875 [Mariniblastus sp.]|nr:hypothetical protein [Mariniblastus sp.]
MYVITRNRNCYLQNDGSWQWLEVATSKIFESSNSAENWIIRESLPEDFVTVSYLPRVLAAEDKRTEKQDKKSRKALSRGTFVELPSPIDFYMSEDAPEDSPWCIFDRFTASHTLLHEGDVLGAFGTTSCDHMPFYCYSGDEYYHSFEHYTRQSSESN